MILLIDNYDSFTYNLVQTIGGLDPDVDLRVVRNDQITVDEIAERKPAKIIISPGPGTPLDAGISVAVIQRFAREIPLLGVCLGHQSIAHAFGGRVIRAKRLLHGKTSEINHDDAGVFAGLSKPLVATRYHSLIVEPQSLPKEFEVCATTADDSTEIMGLRHREYPLHGVQFHPESFLTAEGPQLLANFLAIS